MLIENINEKGIEHLEKAVKELAKENPEITTKIYDMERVDKINIINELKILREEIRSFFSPESV